MGSQDGDPHAEARERIAALVRSPSESRRLLPGVMGLLDSDDTYLRLSAACGICLAGTADPDMLPYLIRRLIDRLHSDGPRAEAVFAFEYLATQFPEQVDEILQDLRETTGREPLDYARQGGFRRSNIYSPSMGRDGVGRTRIAGEGTDPGPQQVYNDDGDAVERHAGPDEGRTETNDDESGYADDIDEPASQDDAAENETTTAGRPDWDLEPADVEMITAESAFTDIAVLARREQGRFADDYLAIAIARGNEQAIILRLFRRPEEKRDGFSKHLWVALDRWNRVSATDHVVPLYDRGARPRPWAAVGYTDRTLADRGRLPVEEAIWNGVVLARGVATLHDNDVVHGGLDPRSIAYTGAIMDDSERQAPLLDHVGLVEAFRFHFDPAACLDPRYAAPEYYDPKFGSIDHTTDIYQLGTILYRLFTGMPPYSSGSDPVKKQVLRGSAVSPSERLESVPGLVDDVVSKAMATQKLTRYETAAQLEQDLLRLRDHLVTDGD